MRILMLPSDGIGPETVAATLEVLSAAARTCRRPQGPGHLFILRP